jgi:hypothetical protein
MRRHAEAMADRGYVGELETEECRFAVTQAEMFVDAKKIDIDVLTNYSKKMELETLNGNLNAARAKLAADEERAKMDAIRRDLAIEELSYCTLKAEKRVGDPPLGGQMAEYARDRRGRHRAQGPCPVAHAGPVQDASEGRHSRIRGRPRGAGTGADAKLVGCAEEYFELNHLEIARGRWLTRRDRGKKVVVLADDTAKRLFPFENPLGKTIWVGSEFSVVIGQTRPRMAAAAIGGSFDARDYNLDAYIPLETLRHRVAEEVARVHGVRPASHPRAEWQSRRQGVESRGSRGAVRVRAAAYEPPDEAHRMIECSRAGSVDN